jgi:hypothetical protein
LINMHHLRNIETIEFLKRKGKRLANIKNKMFKYMSKLDH